jgi:hypothetical protein
VESKDRVLKQRVRRKDSVIETSSVGSCGVSSNSDGCTLIKQRDPVTDSYLGTRCETCCCCCCYCCCGGPNRLRRFPTDHCGRRVDLHHFSHSAFFLIPLEQQRNKSKSHSFYSKDQQQSQGHESLGLSLIPSTKALSLSLSLSFPFYSNKATRIIVIMDVEPKVKLVRA